MPATTSPTGILMIARPVWRSRASRTAKLVLPRPYAAATPLWFSLAVFPWCVEMAFKGLLGAARVLQGGRFMLRVTPSTLATERQRSCHSGG
jgi:hypothetical protein